MDEIDNFFNSVYNDFINLFKQQTPQLQSKIINQYNSTTQTLNGISGYIKDISFIVNVPTTASISPQIT